MAGTKRSLRQRRHARAVAAFTLIEVLMSIFVLALGLLGLGALIPGIIREQRVASDRTLGVVVANDAKAYLSVRQDLKRLAIAPAPGGPGLGTGAGREFGIGVWLYDPEWSETYAWDLNSIDANAYEDAGDIVIGDRVDRVPPVRIPLEERLYPAPSSGLDAPQFVWDFVARRLPPTEAEGYALLADGPIPLPTGLPESLRAGVEVAVFVRRVDTGIRVPRGETAYGQMLRASEPILPVGLDSAGLLTGAGGRTADNQTYAPPLTLEAEYDGTRTDVLRLTGIPGGAGTEPRSGVAAEQRRLLASQVGQQLVDNLGNVYTVDEVLSVGTSSAEVRIRPAIDQWVPATSGGSLSWDDEESWTEIRQVVFVPQQPATTIVFRIGVEPNAVPSPSGSGAGRLPL